MVKWEVNQKPMRDFEVYLNELENQNKEIEIAFCDITNSWIRYVIKIKDKVKAESKAEVENTTKVEPAKTAKKTTTRKRTTAKDKK